MGAGISSLRPATSTAARAYLKAEDDRATKRDSGACMSLSGQGAQEIHAPQPSAARVYVPHSPSREMIRRGKQPAVNSDEDVQEAAEAAQASTSSALSSSLHHTGQSSCDLSLIDRNMTLALLNEYRRRLPDARLDIIDGPTFTQVSKEIGIHRDNPILSACRNRIEEIEQNNEKFTHLDHSVASLRGLCESTLSQLRKLLTQRQTAIVDPALQSSALRQTQEQQIEACLQHVEDLQTIVKALMGQFERCGAAATREAETKVICDRLRKTIATIQAEKAKVAAGVNQKAKAAFLATLIVGGVGAVASVIWAVLNVLDILAAHAVLAHILLGIGAVVFAVAFLFVKWADIKNMWVDKVHEDSHTLIEVYDSLLSCYKNVEKIMDRTELRNTMEFSRTSVQVSSLAAAASVDTNHAIKRLEEKLAQLQEQHRKELTQQEERHAEKGKAPADSDQYITKAQFEEYKAEMNKGFAAILEALKNKA